MIRDLTIFATFVNIFLSVLGLLIILFSLIRITRLLDSGLMGHWFANAQTNVTACLRHPSTDRGNTVRKLNLEAFFGPFLFYFSG